MRILGLETSCDETGVALYEAGVGIVGEALATQTALHAPFGGVVPELASRDHIAKLAPLIAKVLDEAGCTLADLDGIAYTAGPGLVGALMVGGALAGALGLALGVPAIPVHHLEGHLLAVMLEEEPPEFPFVALLVSGGHTQLIEVAGVGRYRLLGETLDDAAGEAFDKFARLLGLPYPGGPALAALADRGDPMRFDLPRPMIHRGLDFSFSGLKTAARLALEDATGRHRNAVSDSLRADLAASFQQAVVDTLVAKCARAVEETAIGRIIVAGGVGANQALRGRLAAWGQTAGVAVRYPAPALCTDNGAMIAYAGACRRQIEPSAQGGIVVRPRWSLEALAPA
jgi:N6-L-threonylcarbamoyladenine synthase